MDGTALRAGAVACVKTVKNPILVARRICDDSPHVLMCGPGAEAFAREFGIPEVPNASLITQRQRTRWRSLPRWLAEFPGQMPTRPCSLT